MLPIEYMICGTEDVLEDEENPSTEDALNCSTYFAFGSFVELA